MTSHLSLHRLPVLILALTLLLAGCGGAATTPPSPQPTSASSFRVAVVLPDSNGIWAQAGLQGIKAIEATFGAQVSYTSNVTTADSEAVIRKYAQEGYDLIIAHGGEYITSTEIVAKEFPRIKFASVGGSYPGNNVNFGGLAIKNDEMNYLMGAIAAIKTRANKVALIGGLKRPQPEFMDKDEAYEKGAQSINPTIQVTTEWIGSDNDLTKGREIAQKLIANGYDVLALDAGATDAVIIETARDAGIYVIGTYVDQHDLAPKTVLLTMLGDMDALYLTAATLVQQGKWEGRLYRLGAREGAIKLTPSYGLLTPEEEQKVLALLR